MSWRATVVWSLLAALVGFGLFHVKYQVQTLEDRLAKLNRAVVHEQEQIHVLRAEWTHLDRPERIEELSRKFLDLAPPKPDQIGSADQLPMRPANEPTADHSAQPGQPATVPGDRKPAGGAAPVADDYRALAPTPVAVHPLPETPRDNSSPFLPGGGR